jgi:hypothetical protein
VPTKAGRLRARYVLHAVSAWQEASCIARATQRALLFAARKVAAFRETLAAVLTGKDVHRETGPADAHAGAAGRDRDRRRDVRGVVETRRGVGSEANRYSRARQASSMGGRLRQ